MTVNLKFLIVSAVFAEIGIIMAPQMINANITEIVGVAMLLIGVLGMGMGLGLPPKKDEK